MQKVAKMFYNTVLMTVIFIVVNSLISSAQTPPPAPALTGLSYTEHFGLGGSLGMLNTASIDHFMATGHSIESVELFSGSILLQEASAAHTYDLSVTHDLMSMDALAFDAVQLAENARHQVEAKKAQAQRKASASGRTLAFDRQSKGMPEEWELKNFTTCGSSNNASYRARIETVDAFTFMCEDAEAAGIDLVINSAYRDLAYQQMLFSRAVSKYGSAAAASKWVAQPRNGVCTSKHCAGLAIDISSANGAHPWMHAFVGCYSDGILDTTRTSCSSSERPVKRIQLYGMIFPLSHEAWHAELGIPVVTASSGVSSASCNPPGSYSVPQMISAIWRCRLADAGVTGSAQDKIVAEAIVVAKCESGWDSSIVAFGGRYVNSSHPSTGYRYTAAGVFQFIRATADAWITGGYANVSDPVANIDAAARLYLSGYKAGRDPWQPWECAAVNGQFASKSVLPGYPNGPAALPDYAWQY